MIDLHLHLDGSLPVQTVIELAKSQNIQLPAWDPVLLKQQLSVPENCQNLAEYIACFKTPLRLLQTRGAIGLAVSGLLAALEEQGLWYAEIRFAPALHTQRGLTQSQVVKAAAEALQKGLVGKRLKAALILCCMRGEANDADNHETLKVAQDYLGHGVAAVDLAGDEHGFPTEKYRGLFKTADTMGLPFTLHAGEAAGADSIRLALEYGAKRIGHGVRAGEDQGVIDYLKEHQIPLEMCVTSNLQTRAVAGIRQHPILQYLRDGLCVTCNTDNMTVSNTTLQKEFQLLETELGLRRQDKEKLIFNSIEAAFLPEKEKQKLYGIR